VLSLEFQALRAGRVQAGLNGRLVGSGPPSLVFAYMGSNALLLPGLGTTDGEGESRRTRSAAQTAGGF
jgi:hypothetical protein